MSESHHDKVKDVGSNPALKIEVVWLLFNGKTDSLSVLTRTAFTWADGGYTTASKAVNQGSIPW